MIINKLKAFFFDVDGTKIDSDKEVTKIINKIKKKFFKNKKKVTIKKVANLSSMGGIQLIQKTLGVKTKKFFYLKLFRDEYLQRKPDHNLLFANLEKLMKYLKRNNIKIYLCTNKPNILVNKLVMNTYLKDYIDEYFCADTYGLKKPDKKFLKKILKKTNTKKNEVAYIGDSLIDYKFCENDIENFFLFYNPRIDYPKRFLLKLKKKNKIIYNYDNFNFFK